MLTQAPFELTSHLADRFSAPVSPNSSSGLTGPLEYSDMGFHINMGRSAERSAMPVPRIERRCYTYSTECLAVASASTAAGRRPTTNHRIAVCSSSERSCEMQSLIIMHKSLMQRPSTQCFDCVKPTLNSEAHARRNQERKELLSFLNTRGWDRLARRMRQPHLQLVVGCGSKVKKAPTTST